MARKPRKPKKDFIHDPHFKYFKDALSKKIKAYAVEPEDLLGIQKKQIETLVKLERDFRKKLIKHKNFKTVYEKFIRYIKEEKRNVLSARPFFRVRQKKFTRFISSALKNNNINALSRYHFNYNFILFASNCVKWPKNEELLKIKKQIEFIRSEVVVMNLPLGISQARMFYSKTPKDQLTYMDFIQISCEGLLAAIDKFCLPFSRVFRAVAIGRMLGNFIQNYSETLTHFYPNDKRKIYRANKIIGKNVDSKESIDYNVLAKSVNEHMPKQNQTNASELSNLLGAQTCMSIDSTVTDDPENVNSIHNKSTIPVEYQPDEIFEAAEAQEKMKYHIGDLSVMEIKLLQLKGVPV